MCGGGGTAGAAGASAPIALWVSQVSGCSAGAGCGCKGVHKLFKSPRKKTNAKSCLMSIFVRD